jgi:hypothetical protein
VLLVLLVLLLLLVVVVVLVVVLEVVVLVLLVPVLNHCQSTQTLSQGLKKDANNNKNKMEEEQGALSCINFSLLISSYKPIAGRKPWTRLHLWRCFFPRRHG